MTTDIFDVCCYSCVWNFRNSFRLFTTPARDL